MADRHIVRVAKCSSIHLTKVHMEAGYCIPGRMPTVDFKTSQVSLVVLAVWLGDVCNYCGLMNEISIHPDYILYWSSVSDLTQGGSCYPLFCRAKLLQAADTTPEQLCTNAGKVGEMCSLPFYLSDWLRKNRLSFPCSSLKVTSNMHLQEWNNIIHYHLWCCF